MFFVTFLSMLIASTIAHVPSCKEDIYRSNFQLDIPKVIGMWHDISRTPTPFDPESSKCTNIETCLNKNGTINVTVANLNTITGFVDNWGGLFVPEGKESTANFKFLLPPKAIHPKLMFTVLDTDYTHYIVGLVIKDYDKGSSWCVPYVRLASRDRTLAPKYYHHAIEVLRKNNIRTDNLEFMNQDDCENWQNRKYNDRTL